MESSSGQLSGTAKGIVQLGAGLFMVVMGLNMLNLFPWLRSLTPRLPRFLTSRATAAAGSNSPLYVGLLNGLMPCGPLQAMQLYALSTGSPLKARSRCAVQPGHRAVDVRFGRAEST